MNVDYHFHLEEGPYSLRWWTRTAQACLSFCDPGVTQHSQAWMTEVTKIMDRRIEEGAYSVFWFDLYLQRAKDLGLREAGVVDHLYRFREFLPYYLNHIHVGNDELGNLQKGWLYQVSCESIDRYIAFIQSQKEKWKNEGIELRLGIEADFFPDGEKELQSILAPYPWDFVIGSVHFVEGWGFDNPETNERFKQFDLLSLYQNFFQYVERAISSRLFDILAHLDNLKAFGYRPDEEALIPYYHRIAKKLKEYDVATEVNTGLAYRYPVKEMCPSPTFLSILAQYQVAVTISSDAHFPDDLGTYQEEARKMLKTAGFHRISTFKERKRTEHEL